MKTIRPINAGYFIIYGLTLIAFADLVYTAISYSVGADSFSTMFSYWSLLIFIAAVAYAQHYVRARIVISPQSVRIVQPTYIMPKPNEKRVNFIFRQDQLDNVLIDSKFDPRQIEKYGYAKELGLKNRDKSPNTDKLKLFALNEVAFITKDGKDYRLNAGSYTKKQLSEIVNLIKQYSNVDPTGTLA
ncbi:MAG: hypothetical protein Q4D04_03085 [Clostridia bacterium]|nr:hypothetical protein [Clostridia bacterium]